MRPKRATNASVRSDSSRFARSAAARSALKHCANSRRSVSRQVLCFEFDGLDPEYKTLVIVHSAHRARNARVFGSVANGSDTDESDLDILSAGCAAVAA